MFVSLSVVPSRCAVFQDGSHVKIPTSATFNSFSTQLTAYHAPYKLRKSLPQAGAVGKEYTFLEPAKTLGVGEYLEYKSNITHSLFVFVLERELFGIFDYRN